MMSKGIGRPPTSRPEVRKYGPSPPLTPAHRPKVGQRMNSATPQTSQYRGNSSTESRSRLSTPPRGPGDYGPTLSNNDFYSGVWAYRGGIKIDYLGSWANSRRPSLPQGLSRERRWRSTHAGGVRLRTGCRVKANPEMGGPTPLGYYPHSQLTRLRTPTSCIHRGGGFYAGSLVRSMVGADRPYTCTITRNPRVNVLTTGAQRTEVTA